MSILKTVDHERRVDGVGVVVTQNIWDDGRTTYSLYQIWGGLNLIQLVCHDDFDHFPTDDEIAKALNEQ